MSNFFEHKKIMLYQYAGKKDLCYFGYFYGYRWQKLELQDSGFWSFKTKQEKLISTTLFTHTVVTYASHDQIFALNSIWEVKNFQFYEKVFKTKSYNIKVY